MRKKLTLLVRISSGFVFVTALVWFGFFEGATVVSAGKPITGWAMQHVPAYAGCKGLDCGGKQEYLPYYDRFDRCESDPDAPSCTGDTALCDNGTNMACEDVRDVCFTDDDGNYVCPEVFYKVILSNSAGEAVFDTNLGDDVISRSTAGAMSGYGMIGTMTDFIRFFDAEQNDKCMVQHRNYAYIYIPEGQYSFGINLERDESDPACYYCPAGADECNGDNYLEDHFGFCCNCEREEEGGYVCTTKVHYNCAFQPGCFKEAACHAERIDCTPNCGGVVYAWVVADGAGTSGSPYEPPTYNSTKTLAQRYSQDFVGKSHSLVTYDSSAMTSGSVWADAKYYGGGWYPVQISASWGDSYLYYPQLLWRAGSTGVGAVYADEVGEAKISACAPGSKPCKCTSGLPIELEGDRENMSVTGIGTITDYDPSSFEVTSSNSDVLTILSSSVDGTPPAPLGVGAQVTTADVVGTQTVTLRITAESSPPGDTACNCPVTVRVTSPPKDWWQVVDADIFTSGDLGSLVPDGLKFELPGAGEYPGIPVYLGNLNGITSENVSDTHWLVKSDYGTKAKSYTYAFFERMAEGKAFTNLTGSSIDWSLLPVATPDQGFKWYKTAEEGGDFSLSKTSGDIALGATEKVIIFVNGNLNIKKNIDVPAGTSNLVIFASGNITIDPAVTGVEGIFFAGGKFNTGTDGSDNPLVVEGSVVALDGVELERNISDALSPTTPAEKFTYRPDLVLGLPTLFSSSRMEWREVAP